MSKSDDWNPLRWKEICRSEVRYLVHQTLSANRSSTIFDVCERLVPLRAVAVHSKPNSFFHVGTKSYSLYNENNLRVDLFTTYANNRRNESTLNVARKREFVLVLHKLCVHDKHVNKLQKNVT